MKRKPQAPRKVRISLATRAPRLETLDFLGDMPAREFRAASHRVADTLADYLEKVEAYPVLPRIVPGDVQRLLPIAPPSRGEPIARILKDYQRIIEPHVTHWNHPGFLAYFASSGSGPGILGESLAAGLNTNAMIWRTGPAQTELEERVCDWLRRMFGLPKIFRGHINDTASISTLLALAAARQRLPGLDIRRRGLAGRPELPKLVIYASEQAHSSVDKAAVVLGLGSEQVRKIPVDADFRMRSEALERAIAADRAAGHLPVAVVGTAGTTSTTSFDPLPALAALCRREKVWLHVDAAFGGSAAVCAEFRSHLKGWEQADSIVINPHKWLFTPIDCSVLLVRDPEALRVAFAVTPEYLHTREQGATNLMDHGVQLGRRFRSLKLWMVLRYFGVAGLRQRLRAHVKWAQEFAGWIKREQGFELCAPAPLNTVCFRAVPKALHDKPEALDRFNEQLLAEVNAAGPVFVSHTKLHGRYCLRLSVGNIRTQRKQVLEAWELILEKARRLPNR